jgi:hypothetical protein
MEVWMMEVWMMEVWMMEDLILILGSNRYFILELNKVQN